MQSEERKRTQIIQELEVLSTIIDSIELEDSMQMQSIQVRTPNKALFYGISR